MANPAASTISPARRDTPDLPWWKTTVIYQIYPRSFKDSNGDGIGDLRGIISKLNYFVYLGVETLWLSPFFTSPQADFGYDISDYKDVDPIFGTMEDFRELVKQCKLRGLRILLDFVCNHTSDRHEWFQKSLRKQGKYKDYYVWTDGKVLPDALFSYHQVSVFGGSAWEWCEERQQFYYHAFLAEQPDLNFRNPDVVEEMSLVMKYWLDLGVDGFRMDAVANLFESEDIFQDNPPSGKDVPPVSHWEYLKPVHNFYVLPECRDLLVHWQNVLDKEKQIDGKERFMVQEFYTDSDTRAAMAEYGAHAFNMDLVEELTVPLSATQMMGLIAKEYTDRPESYWPTFVVGNHDKARPATKYGPRYVDAFNMLLMTLKGTPTIYYGDELGMQDSSVAYEEAQDPFGIKIGPERYALFGRDPCRTPMQWTSETQAGFTTSRKPWLPVGKDHEQRNVQSQKKDEKSHLNLLKEYVALRSKDAFKYGDIGLDCVLNKNVLAFLRFFGSERYLVAINFGQESSTDDHRGGPVAVATGTVVANTGAVSDDLAKGRTIDLSSLTLRPGDGLVIQL
ncbi:hypothetical protein EGW08_019228 [Elysia chlorotica]|uniref:Glycosyl hydrolase family 13 catalytic domain-containing protein n=1 Tax=Elysia chlorotica TaxID=188477 RepID=A0A3S1B0B4_ELYCH|nr:hypothetical protein EGW08_019228 [Elysia chlorotica]